MLACPKCNSYMFAGRKKEVQIDCCSKCEGIWLDSGELAQITNTPRDLPQEGQPTDPTEYPCPHCGVKLATRPYSNDNPVMIDLCLKCSGVYLDKGELQKFDSLARKVEYSFPPPHRERMTGKARWNEAASAVYNTESPAAKSPKLDRMSFVNQVYQLLVVTLLITGGTAYWGVTSGLAQKYFLPAIIAEVVVFFIALGVRRMDGINLVALFSYTALSGFTLAAVLTNYFQQGHVNIVWEAAGISAVVFLVLSTYVHVSKQDFEWMGGVLFAGLIILIITGIGMLFLGNAFSWFLWSCVSAFIFCGYILYDTSQIILKYDTDEVVAAVLNLYLDIVNLFLDLLRILSYLSKD
jgi:modulator of FtsH protease